MKAHPSMPGSIANVAYETGVIAERQRWLNAIAEVLVTDTCYCGDCGFRNSTPYVYVEDLKSVALARNQEYANAGVTESTHTKQHQCNADLATRAALRAEGAQAELERITKLFEDIKNEASSAQNWLHKVARTAFADAAIKLIKGEQK